MRIRDFIRKQLESCIINLTPSDIIVVTCEHKLLLSSRQQISDEITKLTGNKVLVLDADLKIKIFKREANETK